MKSESQSNDPWFEPGDRLGDYRVVRVMEVGYFSWNLEVEDAIGRRYHAVVHKRVDVQPDATRSGIRFEAGLDHPGLPKIIHVGEPNTATRDHVWFVRELLPPPLSHRVRELGQVWNAQEVLEAGLGVCRLLEYLHDEPPGDSITSGTPAERLGLLGHTHGGNE